MPKMNSYFVYRLFMDFLHRGDIVKPVIGRMEVLLMVLFILKVMFFLSVFFVAGVYMESNFDDCPYNKKKRSTDSLKEDTVEQETASPVVASIQS